MYIGKKIRLLREELKLSQAEFARQVSVSQAYYSDIERGKKKISKKMLRKVMEIWPEYASFFENNENNNIKNWGDKMGGTESGIENQKSAGQNPLIKRPDKLSNIQVSEIQGFRYFEKFLNTVYANPELSEIYNFSLVLKEMSEFFHKVVDEYINYPAIELLFKADYRDYEDFKQLNIKALNQVSEYKEVFLPVMEVLEKFLKQDFPPFDTKEVLEDSILDWLRSKKENN